MSGTRRILLAVSALALSVGCVRSSGADVGSRLAAVEQASRPEVALDKARAFARIGDFTRAEQYLRLALDGGGDERELTPLLVEACVRDHRYQDAVQHVEHYLRRHPEDSRLRFVLASLEAAIGGHERAQREYEKVLQAEPNNSDAHYALAVLLRDRIANLSAADQHFREYLRLRPGGRHAEEARAALLEVVP